MQIITANKKACLSGQKQIGLFVFYLSIAAYIIHPQIQPLTPFQSFFFKTYYSLGIV